MWLTSQRPRHRWALQATLDGNEYALSTFVQVRIINAKNLNSYCTWQGEPGRARKNRRGKIAGVRMSWVVVKPLSIQLTYLLG